MTRQELLVQVSSFLGRFAYEVKVANSMGLLDINKIAEDFLIPVMSTVLDCPDLQNQNLIKMNFPAVDLGCRTSRISIQVTSDPSSSKISESLRKFDEHNLSSKFDHVFVYIITEKQKSYTSQLLTETIQGFSGSFDPNTNILDYQSLAKLIESLPDEKVGYLNQYLEKKFSDLDKHLLFRENLESFLALSQQKIEKEKQTKKYISSIFIETSKTKEDMRYFSNPLFFFRKILDDIGDIDFSRLNKLLGMSKIDAIEADLSAITHGIQPSNLVNLNDQIVELNDRVGQVLESITPFSWAGERTERFSPNDYVSGFWSVFKISIQSEGNQIYRDLENVFKKIKLINTKIFLVTGMAGQGKTNFICDLVENQYRRFEVPTIFIPARVLNDYAGPDRILSYVRNNRFAPDFTDIHELFTLLDSVAKECDAPFIFAIDGINEVTDLDGFVSELRLFLEALCQYDFIKVVVTCRSEFFDHRFSEVFEPQFSEVTYRVKDLRSKMSSKNKSRLLETYLTHYNIKTSLSGSAKEFLREDFILLRIFCEINEGEDIGHVSDVYKGEIFEAYLLKKVSEFPRENHRLVLDTLYKICAAMIEKEEFSQLSLEGFNEVERRIISQLINEDIILRREVPTTSLASVGNECLSFTFDELRDFLLAFYSIEKLSPLEHAKLESLFSRISDWPIYEGYFRYLYLLARKTGRQKIISLCEESVDFETHYVNNLYVLPADIQDSTDCERVSNILRQSSERDDIQHIAWFLFRKRRLTEHLNIQILLDHVNALRDAEHGKFFKLMFCDRYDFGSSQWKSRITDLVNSFIELEDEEKIRIEAPAISLVLHLVVYANWEEREKTLNFFEQHQSVEEILSAINICREAQSNGVQSGISEVFGEEM